MSVAKVTLQRDAKLLADKILAQQDYDTQKGTVDQLTAAVQADQPRSTMPGSSSVIRGLLLRSMAAPGCGKWIKEYYSCQRDSNGLVVITQLRPISMVFTLPEQNLREVQDQLNAGHELLVMAMDRIIAYSGSGQAGGGG